MRFHLIDVMSLLVILQLPLLLLKFVVPSAGQVNLPTFIWYGL